MSQFNPNQYEFLFEEKRRPQGYRPAAVARGFKNPNQPKKPKLAVPTDGDLKKGLRALIQKHGSIAAVPAAEAKKFLSRFQNHPLKKGMKLKGEGAANKAIKTLADKMKVSVAVKPTGAKPKAAQGQMKLRGEYETAAERKKTEAPRKAAQQANLARSQKELAKARGAEKETTARKELDKRQQAEADRINKRKAEQKGRKPIDPKKQLARVNKAATEGAKTAGKQVGKQVGKSALGRAGAGLGFRAIMPLLGGVPGAALLALSMLPLLGITGKTSSAERSNLIQKRRSELEMQGILEGQRAPTAMDRFRQQNRLGGLQAMRRSAETNKPLSMSPELAGLLAGSETELQTRLQQAPGQQRTISLSDIMNMSGGN